MDDLETFKQSRLKMEPQSRKFTDAQWEKAYKAHLKALKYGNRKKISSKHSRTTSKSHSRSSESSTKSSSLPRTQKLRRTLRQRSAYSELRSLVDILNYSAIVLILFDALTFGTEVGQSNSLFSSILSAFLKTIAVVLVRNFFQVVIDIADVALDYRVQASKKRSDASAS